MRKSFYSQSDEVCLTGLQGILTIIFYPKKDLRKIHANKILSYRENLYICTFITVIGMSLALSTLLLAVAAFVTALFLAAFAIPRIISVAKAKKLFDVPDGGRKIHKEVIPNLGGVGVFFAYIIVTSLFVDPSQFTRWSYIASATLILFFTGVKDDLVSMTPSKKFLAQAIAAFIVVFFADIRVVSLHGLFGVYTLPVIVSQIFTIVGCVFVTNAFNLMDGIDALAGSVSVMASLILGIVFYLSGHHSEALIAFSMGGAVAGFLLYNKPPARIFMGDTGALVIGFTLSILCVLMIEQAETSTGPQGLVHSPVGALLLSLAVLFAPLFDTFRIFTVRIIKGRSPFQADRTHLHHYLLDLGLSHGKAVLTILTANLFILAVAYFLQDTNPHLAILTMILVAAGMFTILFIVRHKKIEPKAKEVLPVAPLKEMVSIAPMASITPVAHATPVTVSKKPVTAQERPFFPSGKPIGR